MKKRGVKEREKESKRAVEYLFGRRKRGNPLISQTEIEFVRG